jgi:NhaA family Na+:H+ antiporter
VPLGGISLEGDATRVLGGVTLGLVAGKPLGITAASWIAVRLGVAALPAGVTWGQVGVVGLAGGIGFTMAIFIAALAFPAGPLLETAKLAILAASVAAGTLALLSGRALLPRE